MTAVSLLLYGLPGDDRFFASACHVCEGGVSEQAVPEELFVGC